MKIVSFNILKQITPIVPNPYIITETTITTDGPRTRICDGRFTSEKIALEMLKSKEEYSKNILKVNT